MGKVALRTSARAGQPGADQGPELCPVGGSGLLTTPVPGICSGAVKGRAAFKQHLPALAQPLGNPSLDPGKARPPDRSVSPESATLRPLGGRGWLKALQLPIEPGKAGAAPVLIEQLHFASRSLLSLR